MDKPEALRLADALVADRWHPRYREHAAAELRRLHAENERLTTLLADVGQVEAELTEKSDEVHRLHAVNEELLEALKLLLDEQEGPPSIRRHRQWQAAVDACRAAIARAEGEQT